MSFSRPCALMLKPCPVQLNKKYNDFCLLNGYEYLFPFTDKFSFQKHITDVHSIPDNHFKHKYAIRVFK